MTIIKIGDKIKKELSKPPTKENYDLKIMVFRSPEFFPVAKWLVLSGPFNEIQLDKFRPVSWIHWPIPLSNHKIPCVNDN